jgi:D-psicose/D-tagatose/L-ribulose 3-epimerase
MPMKLAMNMLAWTDDVTDPSYRPVLEMLVDAGYDGIEVPIFALDPAPYQVLGNQLRELGLAALALTAPVPDAHPVSADPMQRQSARERNLRALECAAAVGATLIAGPLHASPTVFTEMAPTQQERDWAASGLREIAEAADALGIDLAIESLNHFEQYLTTTAAETAALCRTVDHPRCRMLYDTFHAHMEEKDIAEAIADASDMIGYVHLSESDRSIPGTAQVDWRTTFRTLRRSGYGGWFTIEAFSHNHPEITRQMRTWRQRYDSERELAYEGARFLRAAWGAAGGD